MSLAENDINLLKNRAISDIEKARDLELMQSVYRKYLGKNGEITQILHSLKNLSNEERIKIGREANLLKNFIEKEISVKSDILENESSNPQKDIGHIDVTRPGKKIETGHLHPLTIVKREAEKIFESMGFSVAEGPEIESEWYNFDALNIPKDHPARDQWDTFWLKESEGKKLLLRTHTSPVQIRYMESHHPPIRIIAPGNVFRHEATDASHEFQLSQIEGLMVDKKISVPSFKAVVREFFRQFFKKEVKLRLRPDFFPFTEPSFDVSISCLVCGGKGCGACKETGWVELAGAGMVHPNVLKACKLNPKEWQGWAFGFGIDRLAMMKYKIDNIRLFRSGDLRFLSQF